MHESIEWLYGLQHFGIKLGLDNIRALLGELGHPERALRCVHVAGTNGKGSVAAIVDAMLLASGVRSGLFTSPHLVRPNERIRIAGKDIGSEELHARLSELRGVIERGLDAGRLEAHPSFFEVVTATALQAFRDHAVEVAVLEVGLGGRLDATNAVDADVGVVVSIAHDHTKTLGERLEQIAAEKAGIVKPGMPLVSGVVQQRAVDVVRRTCRQRGARWIDAAREVRLTVENDDGFTLATQRRIYPGLRCALEGRHQIHNTRVAVAAFERMVEILDRRPDADAVRVGLAAVRWPGRLQWLDPGDGLPRLLLDGAHNPAGVEALARHLAATALEPPVMLFGATNGKPLDRMLEPLRAVAPRVVVTRPPVDRGLDADEVAEMARSRFETVTTVAEPAQAIEVARGLAGSDGWVLVTGSLYLVGFVLGSVAAEEVPGPLAL